MSVLVPALVVVPLLGAALLVLLTVRAGTTTPRAPGARTVLPAVLVAVVAGSAVVLARVVGAPVAVALGGWPTGIAIPLVVDTFSGLVLVTTGLLALACAAFAIASGEADRRWFPPLVLVLVAGVNGALMTGDLFNLFVFVEIMLLPSYGLALLARAGRGTRERVAGARVFVLVNLLTSTVLLTGIALTYGTAGSVVLAEIAGAARDSPTVAAATAVVLLALAVKAAVVPFHGWLAEAYPATSPAVTALFSGLHTKVAVYAIYRVYAVVFDGDARWWTVGLVVFTVTMVVGVLGAVGETTTRSILTFHMVSQIGYVLLGVALFSPLGLAAGIFYLIHNMVAKTSLFLSTGAIETGYGAHPVGTVTGLARREPWVAVAFFVGALALAGLPPFSGFVAKLLLVLAAVERGEVVVAAAAVLVSLFTLLSMLKIWTGLFGGREHVPDEADPPADGRCVAVRERTDRRVGAGLLAPGLVLAAATVVLGLGAEPLLALCRDAAAGLVDTTGYVDAVRGAR